MKLLEIYNGLFESKKTELQGVSILKGKGIENAEAIIKQMVSSDKSNNQKNVPVMAFLYDGKIDIKNIIDVINDYDELEKKQRIKPIQIGKDSLRVGDREFKDFIRFSEYIHGEKNKYGKKQDTSSVAADFVANKKPMWSGNGIDIYDGDGVGKCIAYTQGGLTGRGYSFCIGQPGNTMYKSYRDTQGSTFYFIVDRNHFNENEDGSVNLDDPLHIVVFDNTLEGILLTDADNTTGNIAKYGTDPDRYIEYLKSKGVPVDKLVNKPKTPEEEKEDELLGNKNDSLEWFIKLPIEYKSAYIGRGHLLTNDQFDYLIGK